MKFTQIPERLKYNIHFRGTLSDLHINIIDYVMSHFEDSLQYKKKVIALMNRVSYAVICGDTVSLDFDSLDVLDSVPVSDDVMLDLALKELYLDVKSIEWDIEEHITESKLATKAESKPKPTKPKIPKIKPPTPL